MVSPNKYNNKEIGMLLVTVTSNKSRNVTGNIYDIWVEKGY